MKKLLLSSLITAFVVAGVVFAGADIQKTEEAGTYSTTYYDPGDPGSGGD